MSNDISPPLPTLRTGGATPAGDEVREACGEIITSVCRLKDITDPEGDEFFTQRYMDVMSDLADLTRAVGEYMEPDAGLEPMD